MVVAKALAVAASFTEERRLAGQAHAKLASTCERGMNCQQKMRTTTWWGSSTCDVQLDMCNTECGAVAALAWEIVR
eukprot:2740628-Amphidinium_carterae.1